MAARKKFRDALRPFDFQDVITKYTIGHLDLLASIKGLHDRLDLILGRRRLSRENSFDLYMSKVSLATRIIKLEEKV